MSGIVVWKRIPWLRFLLLTKDRWSSCLIVLWPIMMLERQSKGFSGSLAWIREVTGTLMGSLDGKGTLGLGLCALHTVGCIKGKCSVVTYGLRVSKPKNPCFTRSIPFLFYSASYAWLCSAGEGSIAVEWKVLLMKSTVWLGLKRNLGIANICSGTHLPG